MKPALTVWSFIIAVFSVQEKRQISANVISNTAYGSTKLNTWAQWVSRMTGKLGDKNKWFDSSQGIHHGILFIPKNFKFSATINFKTSTFGGTFGTVGPESNVFLVAADDTRDSILLSINTVPSTTDRLQIYLRTESDPNWRFEIPFSFVTARTYYVDIMVLGSKVDVVVSSWGIKTFVHSVDAPSSVVGGSGKLFHSSPWLPMTKSQIMYPQIDEAQSVAKGNSLGFFPLPQELSVSFGLYTQIPLNSSTYLNVFMISASNVTEDPLLKISWRASGSVNYLRVDIFTSATVKVTREYTYSGVMENIFLSIVSGTVTMRMAQRGQSVFLLPAPMRRLENGHVYLSSPWEASSSSSLAIYGLEIGRASEPIVRGKKQGSRQLGRDFRMDLILLLTANAPSAGASIFHARVQKSNQTIMAMSVKPNTSALILETALEDGSTRSIDIAASCTKVPFLRFGIPYDVSLFVGKRLLRMSLTESQDQSRSCEIFLNFPSDRREGYADIYTSNLRDQPAAGFISSISVSQVTALEEGKGTVSSLVSGGGSVTYQLFFDPLANSQPGNVFLLRSSSGRFINFTYSVVPGTLNVTLTIEMVWTSRNKTTYETTLVASSGKIYTFYPYLFQAQPLSLSLQQNGQSLVLTCKSQDCTNPHAGWGDDFDVFLSSPNATPFKGFVTKFDISMRTPPGGSKNPLKMCSLNTPFNKGGAKQMAVKLSQDLNPLGLPSLKNFRSNESITFTNFGDQVLLLVRSAAIRFEVEMRPVSFFVNWGDAQRYTRAPYPTSLSLRLPRIGGGIEYLVIDWEDDGYTNQLRLQGWTSGTGSALPVQTRLDGTVPMNYTGLNFNDWQHSKIIRFNCGAKLQILPVISAVNGSNLAGEERHLFDNDGQYLRINDTWIFYHPKTESERNSFRAGRYSNRNFFSFMFTLTPGNSCAAEAINSGLCSAFSLESVPEQSFFSAKQYELSPAVAIFSEQIQAPDFSGRVLDALEPLRQGRSFDDTFVSSNYKFGFSILPKSVTAGLTNILHLSMNFEDNSFTGSRCPGVWFAPNSTSLQIRMGTLQDRNWGLDIAERLPLGSVTNVTVTFWNGLANVHFNGTLVGSALTTSSRPTGTARIYISNPWIQPADANLANFTFENLAVAP